MIDIDHDPAGCEYQLTIRPNQSISWRATCYLLLSLLLVSGTIAIAMGLLGYWPVVPLAAAQMMLVAYGFYRVARRGQQQEVILFTQDSIRIERGRRRPEQVFILTRLWARVVLEHCPKRWYPSRLLIRSHGDTVEIGRFLSEDERQHLAAELVKCLSAVSVPPSTPQHLSES